jgi:mRNA-degrading endonuclease toxin of MazEF toxin-antitoxin module
MIVSSDAFNSTHEDVIVAAITSQLPARLSPEERAIPLNELAVCGLPKPSIVRLSKIVTLHQRLIIKRVGTVPPATVAVLLNDLRQQF